MVKLQLESIRQQGLKHAAGLVERVHNQVIQAGELFREPVAGNAAVSDGRAIDIGGPGPADP